VGRAVALAAVAACPLYVVHVSTAAAVEALRRARARGQAVFGEVCPHHLLLDDRRYEAQDAADFVMSPPLRPAAEIRALWAALRDGTLDVVSTDHCPFLRRERAAADFASIPNGVAGIEHRLPLLWTHGVASGSITASRFVELVAAAPARVLGLAPAKGAVEPGADADLVLWDPDAEWEVRAAAQKSRCDASVYEGMGVRGRAETVLLRGSVAVEDGELVEPRAPGRFVARRL
jgi:dihydropyrimidinase